MNKETKTNKELLVAAGGRFGSGILLLGFFLLLCAGSIRYWNAWLFLLTFAVLLLAFGTYLYRTDKELLQKRLQVREKENNQKIYVWLTTVVFLGTFGVSGFDYRFGWSNVHIAVVVAALFVLLASYALFVVTLLQNRYASKIIEIQNEQKVIDTGVYSVIRHPMYTAAILMFTSSALVLGSYYALIPMAFYILAIILRLKNEESFLTEQLPGYAAYIKKVKCRLIPFVW